MRETVFMPLVRTTVSDGFPWPSTDPDGEAARKQGMTPHRATSLTRPLSAVLVTACVLALTACGSNDSKDDGDAAGATTDGVTVDTGLLAFNPKTVTISKGQTVTWVGGDNIGHVVVQGTYEVGGDGLRTKENDDKTFSLTLSRKGQRVSHTYSTAGTFTYFCTIHHGMNGTVVVT
jgi:plastocyanin